MKQSVKYFIFFFLSGFLSFQTYGQQIISYNLDVKIDVVSKKVQVKGFLDIDFELRDSLTLVLWKNTDIRSLRLNRVPAKYSFDTASASPIMYIPNGRPLAIVKPSGAGNRDTVFVEYVSDMKMLSGWARSFADNWIELNYYSAWFPIHSRSRNFTSKISITIDTPYNVTGSGMVERKNNFWEMNQPWAGYDNVIIASNALYSRTYQKEKVRIETDYSEFPASALDSLLTECAYVFDYYQNLFGKKDSVYMKFVMAPFEKGGGYSRKNFVSMRTKEFNIYTRGGIGHEIAHFWWSNAVTTTWEDWLNEAFAEYSMLMYFRERLGREVFENRIEEYKHRCTNTPPIWGISRNSQSSYTVLYEKGSLLLYELEQHMGRERFAGFMKSVAVNKIATTADLLVLVEREFSKDIRVWLEEKLKNG